MLSEGYELLHSLDETGFPIPTNHPDVKKPRKNPGYRVGLAKTDSRILWRKWIENQWEDYGITGKARPTLSLS